METNIESPSPTSATAKKPLSLKDIYQQTYEGQTIKEVPEAINLIKAGRKVELTFHNCALNSEVLTEILLTLEGKSCELTLKLTGNTLNPDLIRILILFENNCLKALDLSTDPKSPNSVDYITLMQNIISIINHSSKLRSIRAHGYNINFNPTDPKSTMVTKTTNNSQNVSFKQVGDSFWATFDEFIQTLIKNNSITSLDLPVMNLFDLFDPRTPGSYHPHVYIRKINTLRMTNDLDNANMRIIKLNLYDSNVLENLRRQHFYHEKFSTIYNNIQTGHVPFINHNLYQAFFFVCENLKESVDISVGLNFLTRAWNTRNFSLTSKTILKTALSLIDYYEKREFQTIGSVENAYITTLHFLRDVIAMIKNPRENLEGSKIDLSQEEQSSIFRNFCLEQEEYLKWLFNHDTEQSDKSLALAYQLNINILATIAPELDKLNIPVKSIYRDYLDSIFHYLKKSSTITAWKSGIDVIVLLANHISLSDTTLENKQFKIHKLSDLLKDIFDDCIREFNSNMANISAEHLAQLTQINTAIQAVEYIDSLEKVFSLFSSLISSIQDSLDRTISKTNSQSEIIPILGGPIKDHQQAFTPIAVTETLSEKQPTTVTTVNERLTNLRQRKKNSETNPNEQELEEIGTKKCL